MTDERALFVPLDTGADAGAGTGTGAEAGRGTGNGAEAGRGGGAGRRWPERDRPRRRCGCARSHRHCLRYLRDDSYRRRGRAVACA